MSADDLNDMMENARTASAFLKSLANETRLVLLCLLADGEKSVRELESMLGFRQPTVSQQLARLRADNLVSFRREGKRIYYGLASEDTRQVLGFLHEPYRARNRKQYARILAAITTAAE